MMEIFYEAATNIENSFIKEWKQKGKPIVGYTCTYVPAELIYAAGLLPYRLRGIEAQSADIGDAYFGPYICTLPKCILQLVGEKKYHFLDGTIITPGCDSIRRLDECWRAAGRDIPSIVPDFFFHYAVPHKYTDYSLEFFIDETHRLKSELEKHFNLTISEEKLRSAIKAYNTGRSLLQQLQQHRISGNPSINGVDSMAVNLSSTVMPRDLFNQELSKLLDNLSQSRDNNLSSRKRLCIVGSANDDIELIRLIEQSGFFVVSDNVCYGPRQENYYVNEKEDPIVALSKYHLSYSACPRMVGDYKNRFHQLLELIQASRVDGVLLQNIRFCDLHGSENAVLERDLEKFGIPCMRLEREYGPLVETGRIKMRLDAFIERIKHTQKEQV